MDTTDQRSGYGSLEVAVTAVAAPVTVSGGTALTPEACESKALSATVSGGSGSYEYCWETDGSGVVTITKTQQAGAEVYAGRAGSGSVILTVFDAADHNNNASTTWSFTVTEKTPAAPEVSLDKSTLSLDAGASGALTLTASGGSGEYEYLWSSDNTGVVTVTGSGATAEVQAAAAVTAGANTAEITASVRDKQSGLTSGTASCVVTVKAKTATYNASGSAEVGDNAAFTAIAEQISAAFQQSFGSAPGDTASVRFTGTSAAEGALCTADGAVLSSGTSYSFDSFRTFVFRADAAGSFSTSYTVAEGGNTLEGVISFTVTGGKPLISASLSRSSLSMPTFSQDTLNVTYTPSISCSIEWTTSDPYIVLLSPSGSKVKLETN